MIDINLNPGSPTINKDLDILLQEIDILFDTKYKEVFGSPEYGTDYERFLFDMQISNEVIASQMLYDITSMNLFGYEPHVEVTILEGTMNDIILVEVTLTKKSKVYTRVYKFQ